MTPLNISTGGLAVCLVLVYSALGNAAPNETPDAFVRRVYSRYRAHGPEVSTSRPGGTLFYAPALLDLFAKDEALAKGEVGAIDGDPLCGCQDHASIAVKKVAVSDRSADRVKVEVTIRTLATTSAVTLTLLQTPDGWRIADVGDKTVGSIVALLKDSISHAEEPAKP